MDDLAAIARRRARREGLWLHVDAAYGGFFLLTERGRRRFAGVERADSITLDPHKGLFLPYGTGALLVRDGRRLLEAHEVHGAYLQDLPPEGALPNFADYSARALARRPWAPRLAADRAARPRRLPAALDEKLDLAQHLAAELRGLDGLEVPWEPDLSIVTFRMTGDGGDAEAATVELLAGINASRRVFLSSTTVDGRFTIRACVLSVFTHRDRIDELVEIVRAAVRDLRAR